MAYVLRVKVFFFEFNRFSIQGMVARFRDAPFFRVLAGV